ncbi:hypothetical protein SUGI_0661850 [Cryptomeria japonica]|uniref:CDT1-like protein a, chloroplastic n=1 Tax=Cryptomeria japonica TaxID=3369 RepID=UPI002414CE2F|nr:CDT1-like protein a, chloroplastic [Cryptomeria japonica]GLJ32856.1 hypothetical protein SUGI_0661850 [Cryptomeria japonica]
MDQKSAMKKHTRSTRKEKPPVSKNSPSSHTKMQSVLGFPCKKPVRLSPTLFPKSCSSAKHLTNTPAKTPISLDILTPERKCTPPSSAAKSKGKRFAKSLKDVIEEAKKLQADAHSEQSPLHEEGNDQDQDRVSVKMEAKTPKAADFKLPEKYSGLGEFFDAMEAAIRLLRLRKTISTFGNICPQVETMTHRRFMHAHVAQMKYILPEALLLEKIMVHDEKTLCMKADLKISLLHDALNSAEGGQVFISASKVNTSILRKTFHTRLEEFAQLHPEGDDVPEEMLPEPFNKKCQLTPAKLNILVSPLSCTPNPTPVHEEVMPCLLPNSFQRRFSQRTLTAQASDKVDSNIGYDQSKTPCKVSATKNAAEENTPCKTGQVFDNTNSTMNEGCLLPNSFQRRFSQRTLTAQASNKVDSNIGYDQSETPCKVSATKNAAEENTPCKTVQVFENTNSTMNEGCLLPKSFQRRFSQRTLTAQASDKVDSHIASDQSETPCKVSATKISAAENTPCKTVQVFENTNSTMSKGCFSPTTPGVAPDSTPQKTFSVVSSAHNTPAARTLLNSSNKNSISRRSLRFEHVPNSPDVTAHDLSPKSNSFASPDSSRVSQFSGQKSEISKVRRAVMFKKSNKSSPVSIGKDSSIRSNDLKRKAVMFPSTDTSVLSTPGKLEGMESCADTIEHSPSRVVSTNKSIYSFLSPSKTFSLEKTEGEKTPEEVFLSTPPLHPRKKHRLNATERITKIKATQSCPQTFPPSFQSPTRSNIDPCKADVDRESDASNKPENGSVSIQGLCSKGLDVMNQSEWEILQTLSPKLVHEVHERERKNRDGGLGALAAKRRQQTLACLPKLFNMIRDIFRSSKRSVLTQEELIHKIISNNCNVTDRSEVEEQLLLLQELAPEWISGRTAMSGDFLYSIKNNIDLQTIRTKLVSAL